MLRLLISSSSISIITAASLMCAPLPAISSPPSVSDVDIYSSLCKIGSQTTVAVSAELGLIGRRILAGEGALSASSLKDEFPGIRDENNRLLALQSYQDCMYRYVRIWNAPSSSPSTVESSVVGPTVSPERRREIVYLANELETFKRKMEQTISALPQTMYDKRDSTDKRPKDDARLVGLGDYSRYKAFQSASGGLDFTSASNSDLTLLCTTFEAEVRAYGAFRSQYRPLGLPDYDPTKEFRRICTAAKRGR